MHFCFLEIIVYSKVSVLKMVCVKKAIFLAFLKLNVITDTYMVERTIDLLPAQANQ